MQKPDQITADIFADIAQTFGLSRPAGLCFALIWRSADPPCADDLAQRLGIARSGVSAALKELRGWNLISAARAPGDRKDYFTAPTDTWEVLRLLIAARQRLVIAPLTDRILAAEAATGDARIASLHATLSEVSATLTRLASGDGAALAKGFTALSASPEKPRKKKKKK
ncbi:MAG: MarR family transcriptional regulator [Paracoccaceae bacterium]